MTRPWPLAGPFEARARRYLPSAGPLVVAVSGGLDSTVLLHLARFSGAVDPARLVVAHFDHGLRAESRGDARWVAGLAQAWGLPCQLGAAPEPPGDEAEARRLRYGFLDGVRRGCGAQVLLTAHHADDQAETVLFRALRGTGQRGLRGMAAASAATGRVRLLLPFWRRELEAHARAAGLSWRTDASNADRSRARNALRHEILPRAEALVAPGARAALVRLARNAARDEAAWKAAEDLLLEPVLQARDEGRFVLARPGFLAYHPAIRARLFRRLARDLGVNVDEAGTRVAMEFTSRGLSGGEVHLAGGLRLRRAFDTLVVRVGGTAPEGAGESVAAQVPTPDAGGATALIEGRRVMVRWGPEPLPGWSAAAFRRGSLAFPLELRGWRPGDRMRLAYGTKSVAKLLAEAQVPRWERRGVAVLADAKGRVLWVPGVAFGEAAVPQPERGDFHIGVDDGHSE